MHTNDTHDPLADLGYEQRDLHPKNIFKVSMGFFIFAFASYLIGWWILRAMTNYEAVPNVNTLQSPKLPASPNPLLQTNVTAKTDIKAMREQEHRELVTSGDSTHVQGAHRIPIEQAIKLSAERGAKLQLGAQRGTSGGGG
jgi:hypothetical protein